MQFAKYANVILSFRQITSFWGAFIHRFSKVPDIKSFSSRLCVCWRGADFYYETASLYLYCFIWVRLFKRNQFLIRNCSHRKHDGGGFTLLPWSTGGNVTWNTTKATATRAVNDAGLGEYQWTHTKLVNQITINYKNFQATHGKKRAKKEWGQ